MEEKHKFKLTRLVEDIKAQRRAKDVHDNEERTQNHHFMDTFTAAMQDRVAQAFEDYEAELKVLGWHSHRVSVPSRGPGGAKLDGMAFVFAASSQQKDVRALTFKIVPNAEKRMATYSYEPLAGSEVVMGSIGVNQLTHSWIHDQLNTVLEKAGG